MADHIFKWWLKPSFPFHVLFFSVTLSVPLLPVPLFTSLLCFFRPFEFGWVLRLLWPTTYGISNAVPIVGMDLKCANSQPPCCEKPKPYAEAMFRCFHRQLGYEGTALEAYAALVDIWLQYMRDPKWLVPCWPSQLPEPQEIIINCCFKDLKSWGYFVI